MSRQNEDSVSAVYCHCYPVFNCEPAVYEVQGEHGVWFPLCEGCMQTAWEGGMRVRKLQPREVSS